MRLALDLRSHRTPEDLRAPAPLAGAAEPRLAWPQAARLWVASSLALWSLLGLGAWGLLG
jgi:hypothetical protein